MECGVMVWRGRWSVEWYGVEGKVECGVVECGGEGGVWSVWRGRWNVEGNVEC